MVDLMSEIPQHGVGSTRVLLNVQITNGQIPAKQQDAFDLQPKLLCRRLSRHEVISATFSKAQWSNLGRVLKGYPNLSGLLSL
jgi:hypothetical protein